MLPLWPVPYSRAHHPGRLLWALLCQVHEQGFQLEELSDLLSDSRLTLRCPDNFLSSLLFFSTQSSFFFSSPHPHPLALSLFFNLIMESSTPPEQAAMLAAGEGIIFGEHVSVSRYRSTCGVNLAWRSGGVYYCVPGNMKCSSVRQKWWNAVYEERSLRSPEEISEILQSSHCHYEGC